MRGCRAWRGFSLIELVIVVAIVGVAAAIAVPMVSGSSDRYAVELAALRLATDLDAARRQAVATASDVTVGFDAAQGRVTFNGMTNADGSAYVYELAGVVLTSISFEGGASVVFNGYGSPCCGGVVRLESGGSVAEVSVQAETGAVEVTP